MLCWWEEDPAWLIRCVAGLSRFCTHLIAVDGAYETMEGSYNQPRSTGVQADAIVAAADGYNLGLTLHQPPDPWHGDQVAKRTFMFKTATLFCNPGDWLYVADADEIVTTVPANLDDQLDQMTREGIEVATVEIVQRPHGGVSQIRRFFRYDPTLRCEGGHFRFAAGPKTNRRLLKGDDHSERLLAARHVNGFRFEHWSELRSPQRRALQRDYYGRRAAARLEA